MSTKPSSVKIPDSELAVEMLKRKLVNESQLKAAIDYQESLGGRLLDILSKLGLVRKEAIDAFVRQLLSDEEGGEGASRDEGIHVDPDKLKVHRKLLEKVPQEVVQQNGLLFFFPPPGTRAILVSANEVLSPELHKALQSRLGVELYPIDIEDEIRARFLPERAGSSEAGGGESRTPKKSADTPKSESPRSTEKTREADSLEPEADARVDSSTITDEESRVGELVEIDDPILKALVNLLDRKGIVAKDELRVELELLRRRGEI